MQRRQFMGLVLGAGAMLALPRLSAARPKLELERGGRFVSHGARRWFRPGGPWRPQRWHGCRRHHPVR